MSTAPSPLPNGQGYQKLFVDAYIASKPPQFKPFYDGSLQTPQDRWNLFRQMLAQGFGPLDEEIEGEGMDPYWCMWIRSVRYGQTWEPAGAGDIMSNQVLTPGMYTGPVPAGQIKVSILISDYPPYPVPTGNVLPPPPIPKLAMPVGVLRVPSWQNPINQIGGLFATLVDSTGNDGYSQGDFWPDNDQPGTAQSLTGRWLKVPGFFGIGSYWQKIA